MAERTVQKLAEELFEVAVGAAASHGRRFKQSSAGGLNEITAAAAKEALSLRKFGPRSADEALLSLPARTDHARRAIRAR